MTRRIATYVVLGILAIVVQKFFDDFASISSISPELVILFVVFVTLREGQMVGMEAGFVTGFLNDILSTHFLGFTSFIAVVASFVAGFFYKEADVDLTGRTLNYVWICAIALFVSEFVSIPIVSAGELNYWYVFLKFTVGETVYTALLAMVVVFVNGRKSRYV